MILTSASGPASQPAYEQRTLPRAQHALELLNLDNDALSHVVLHVAGGHGQHDLLHWKHACMLGMTCKQMANLIKASPCFEKICFLGELVGPDVAPGRDVSKESKLLIDRFGSFEPQVRVVFEYGHDHEDKFTYKMQWGVPLLLSEVMEKFYKPPGWKEAVEIELIGDKIPYRKTFPLDKYPIAPSRMRTAGPIKFVACKHLTHNRVNALGDAYTALSFNDLSEEIPAGIHVTVTCSTGLEVFPSGARAHYLPDLELGLCGALPSRLFDNPIFSVYAEKMGMHRTEPPDLWYRWAPEEARKLVGYSSNPSDLERMINPEKASKKAIGKLTKLNMLRKSTDFMLDEWDPNARKRQKLETTAKMQEDLKKLGQRECTDDGPDPLLPRARSPQRKRQPPAEEENENIQKLSDDELSDDESSDDESSDDEDSDGEPPHEELPEKDVDLYGDEESVVSSLNAEEALQMLEDLESAPLNAPSTGPSGAGPSGTAPVYDSDDSDDSDDENFDFMNRLSESFKASKRRLCETQKEKLRRLIKERDEAIGELMKLSGKRGV